MCSETVTNTYNPLTKFLLFVPMTLVSVDLEFSAPRGEILPPGHTTMNPLAGSFLANMGSSSTDPIA